MNAPLEFLTPTVERIAWVLLHSLWQGAMIAFVLAVLLYGLRKRSAAARHAVCLSGLVCMLVSALITAMVVSPSTPSVYHPPTETVVADSDTPTVPVANVPLLRAGDPAGIDLHEPLPGAIAPHVDRKRWRDQVVPILPWIAWLWMCGVLVISLRHCGGWWRVRAL